MDEVAGRPTRKRAAPRLGGDDARPTARASTTQRPDSAPLADGSYARAFELELARRSAVVSRRLGALAEASDVLARQGAALANQGDTLERQSEALARQGAALAHRLAQAEQSASASASEGALRLTMVEGRVDVGADQFGDTTRQLAALSQRLAGLEAASAGVHARIDRALDLAVPAGKRRGLLRRLGRRLRGPRDLAPLVASPFVRLIEDGLLVGGVTSRHRLTLSDPIVTGVLLAYPVVGDGPWQAIEIAVSFDRLPISMDCCLRYDVTDAGARQILTSGVVLIAPGTDRTPLRIRLAQPVGQPGETVMLRLAADAAPSVGLRVYEWRRYSRVPRKPLHRLLFGRAVRGGES